MDFYFKNRNFFGNQEKFFRNQIWNGPKSRNFRNLNEKNELVNIVFFYFLVNFIFNISGAPNIDALLIKMMITVALLCYYIGIASMGAFAIFLFIFPLNALVFRLNKGCQKMQHQSKTKRLEFLKEVDFTIRQILTQLQHIENNKNIKNNQKQLTDNLWNHFCKIVWLGGAIKPKN